jgi:hypothetical protein
MSAGRGLAGLSLLGLLLCGAPGTGAAAPVIGGCPVFPADHAWNTRIDHLPVHPMSNAWINSIGANTTLHPDFGTFYPTPADPIGIPNRIVTNATPVPVVFDAYGNESDPSPYRIPLDTLIEGGPFSDGDRHAIALDTANCFLYELYRAFPNLPNAGVWTADSGSIYDLRGYALRTDGFTSADAAGLPIFAGLVRLAEANAGVIEHAIRFTTNRTNGPHLWPARHDAGNTGNPNDPPMGARFRLKAGVNIDGYSPRIRAIFQAMKHYGLILADNGSRWYISGEHNPGWDDDELVSAFGDLRGSDFEAVDVTPLIIDPNSGQARQPFFAGGLYVATGRVLAATGPAQVVTGPGAGRVGEIRAFDADGTQRLNFQAYPDGYQGGVRLAACDFDGDGRDDVLSVVGPGGASHVRILKFDTNGQPSADLVSFFAYDLGFIGGLYAACGDLDGDGVPEIILGVDAGGAPHLRALRYTPGTPSNVTPLIEAFVYDLGFRGGVRVAAGNLDGGDRDSIVIAAGPGGGPHVRALRWDGSQLVDQAGFFVYDGGFLGGIFVAAGDVLGDARAEIITAADAGGGPHVRVFTGTGDDTGTSFLAYPAGFTGGVRVAAGLVGGTRTIVTGTGAGGAAQVGLFTGGGAPTGGFIAY